jgi:hypothetical protein
MPKSLDLPKLTEVSICCDIKPAGPRHWQSTASQESFQLLYLLWSDFSKPMNPIVLSYHASPQLTEPKAITDVRGG